MKVKTVFRLSPSERTFRLARVLWTRGVVGDGEGYSAKLSFAVRPVLFHRGPELFGWDVTVFGLRVHYQRAYGGIHA